MHDCSQEKRPFPTFETNTIPTIPYTAFTQPTFTLLLSLYQTSTSEQLEHKRVLIFHL